MKARSFDASLLQVRRAYESKYGKIGSLSGEQAGAQLVKDMGFDQARAFVQSQSNDPSAVEMPFASPQ